MAVQVPTISAFDFSFLISKIKYPAQRNLPRLARTVIRAGVNVTSTQRQCGIFAPRVPLATNCQTTQKSKCFATSRRPGGMELRADNCNPPASSARTIAASRVSNPKELADSASSAVQSCRFSFVSTFHLANSDLLRRSGRIACQRPLLSQVALSGRLLTSSQGCNNSKATLSPGVRGTNGLVTERFNSRINACLTFGVPTIVPLGLPLWPFTNRPVIASRIVLCSTSM